MHNNTFIFTYHTNIMRFILKMECNDYKDLIN